MAEFAPYVEGMHEGQGFNTYLQATAGLDAVTIVRGPPEDPGYAIKMQSEFIEKYERLVQSKELTAGSTIKGWGQRLEINTSYLNRLEFETSDLTYEVHVSIRKQSSLSRDSYKFNWRPEKRNPHVYYGDRFIAGFITGGDFFARCSIKKNSRWSQSECKTRAELAFSIFGIHGDISAEARDAVETLHKNAQVKITRSVTGGGSLAADNDQVDLLTLREEALRFYNSPGQQNFRIYAILEDYFKLANFNQEFTPLNYSYARIKSWPLCDEFTLWTYLERVADSIPSTGLPGSNKRKWLSECLEQQQNLVEAVTQVSEDPGKLAEIVHGPRKSPVELMEDIISNVTSIYELRTVSIEQILLDRGRPFRTDYLGATIAIFADGEPMSEYHTLFWKFSAFSFDFPGTILVSLARLSPGDCKYLIDYGWRQVEIVSRSGFWQNRIATGSHWQTDEDRIAEYCYFWAFPSELPDVFGKYRGIKTMTFSSDTAPVNRQAPRVPTAYLWVSTSPPSLPDEMTIYVLPDSGV